MLRVAVLQLDYPVGERRAERIERVAALVAAAPAADLLVLPELWDVAFFAFDDYEREAQPIDEGPVARVTRAGSVVVAGSVLERSAVGLHNTIAVIDSDGRRAGTYRKRHLFSYGSREGELLTAGDATAVFDTAVGRIGVATCFDLRFPEQFAEMRAGGADLIVVPAAWPAAREEHWRVLARARAIETQTPVVAVNGTGDCVGTELAGASLVIDGRGSVVLDAGRAAGWHMATIDPEQTEAWRHEFPLRG